MKRYLLASDFDRTLSFKVWGMVLRALLALAGFEGRIGGLSGIHLVRQGAELAYLLLHDPESRRVGQGHLVEVGKRIRVKQNLHLLTRLLGELDGYEFAFYVISAAPQEVIESALEGIVPADHIYGTRFRYDPASGEIQAIERVTAGYGKMALLEELRAKLHVGHDRVIYVGDGSSAIHVMLHVNRLNGLTIAVSENKYLAQIAKRSVLSDDAVSVLVPILEEIVGMSASGIHALFESHGLVLQEWDKVQTDLLTIRETDSASPLVA